MPPLFSCEITITHEGSPLEGADLRLLSKDGITNWIIGGRTNASGVAKIVTHAQFDGAPAGTYKVLVAKGVMAPSKFPEPGPGASAEEVSAHVDNLKSEIRPTIQHVKPEFDDAAQTPHSITVTKGKNKATFDVGALINQ
ncbi:MAG: hypothetical protein FWC43_03425 [Planctomycetaceae bacterium]|nr:hypothetical protein [Planctomycetaceae bacterium]